MSARLQADKVKFNVGLGLALKLCMEARNVTQGDLSTLLGITQGNVSRLLSGKSGFDCWQLRQVAEHLNVSLDTLYADACR